LPRLGGLRFSWTDNTRNLKEAQFLHYMHSAQFTLSVFCKIRHSEDVSVPGRASQAVPNFESMPAGLTL
jgi:hypothetical protein